jgi:hypothetical protein
MTPPKWSYLHDLSLLGYHETNATSELCCEHDGISESFIDVHQFRSSRKKWIHCFSEVYSITYMASLADYNEPDPSGKFSSKMAAEIATFNEIHDSAWFKYVKTIVVVLTKVDQFALKFKASGSVPMSRCWPGYNASSDGDTSDTAINNAIGNAFLWVYTHSFCIVL